MDSTLCEDCKKERLYFPIGRAKGRIRCASCAKKYFASKIRKTKDIISDKEPLTIWVDNDENLFDSPHLVRANKIEYINNHLMFYLKKELIFKVWLPKENYDGILEALKDVKIRVMGFNAE